MDLRISRWRFRRRIWAFFGILTFVAGTSTIVFTTHEQFVLAFDHSCVTHVDVEMQPTRSGGCRIVRGIIQSIAPHGSTPSERELVFKSDVGNVATFRFRSSDPEWAAVGSSPIGGPAVLETVDALPHLIATETGSSPRIDSPAYQYAGAGVAFLGTLIFSIALLTSRRPPTPRQDIALGVVDLIRDLTA